MFSVTDEFELLALQAALLEAKLPLLSQDRDLSVSPIVASLSERATAACRELPERLWPREEDWRDFSPSHARWAPAVARALSDHEYLRKATRQQKEEYARLLLAPLHNDAPVIAMFLEHVESVLATRRWYQLWLRQESPFGGGVSFLREREDGSFVAVDSQRREIAASKALLDVTDALIERGFEPLGFHVEGPGATRSMP